VQLRLCKFCRFYPAVAIEHREPALLGETLVDPGAPGGSGVSPTVPVAGIRPPPSPGGR
jgi:hypothetical protein